MSAGADWDFGRSRVETSGTIRTVVEVADMQMTNPQMVGYTARPQIDPSVTRGNLDVIFEVISPAP